MVSTTAPPSAYMPGTMWERTQPARRWRPPAGYLPFPDGTSEEPEKRTASARLKEWRVLPRQGGEQVPP